ncbi:MULTISPECIES: hypothetical protein [unclassified Streptomyces]|uniref:hypothetical protein n=1 Tax=unclassified Streptomyces TaxID=2593676 RepID=UPI000A82D578|nr:hypothetical protein [Streptomyces sp. LUP47B]
MGESAVGGARPPVTDPFDAVPELAPLRTAAWDGDWEATRAFFEKIPSAEDVSFAAALLAGVERTERRRLGGPHAGLRFSPSGVGNCCRWT